MAQKPENTSPSESAQCLEHNESARWYCGVCGKPICRACKPIALNYQVYHRSCMDQAREYINNQEAIREEVEAPSLGLKIIAWSFIILGIILFGMALFLFGLALFSHSIPVRVFMSGTVPVSLDSVPGSRTVLNWVGGFSVIISIIVTIIGVGLLNCVAAVRYLILTLAWLEIVVAICGWLVVLLVGKGFWDIPVLGIFFVWYFSQKKVRRQFEKVL